MAPEVKDVKPFLRLVTGTSAPSGTRGSAWPVPQGFYSLCSSAALSPRDSLRFADRPLATLEEKALSGAPAFPAQPYLCPWLLRLGPQSDSP